MKKILSFIAILFCAFTLSAQNNIVNELQRDIPGKGKVTVKTTEKTWFNSELPITQFGETEVLLNNLFNKKVNTRVIFNPTTGGIAKIDKD